jgi:hypothetical protein
VLGVDKKGMKGFDFAIGVSLGGGGRCEGVKYGVMSSELRVVARDK